MELPIWKLSSNPGQYGNWWFLDGRQNVPARGQILEADTSRKIFLDVSKRGTPADALVALHGRFLPWDCSASTTKSRSAETFQTSRGNLECYFVAGGSDVL